MEKTRTANPIAAQDFDDCLPFLLRRTGDRPNPIELIVFVFGIAGLSKLNFMTVSLHPD